MLFSKLIEALPEKRVVGSGDPDISGIAYDSRQVVPGSLFVCIRGGRFDGHEFLVDALAKGACAVVTDDVALASQKASGILFLEVPDTRTALPLLSARFFEYPSRRLKLVGVTGTKGKTTTIHLLEGIMKRAGHDTGVIGTLGVRYSDVVVSASNTTPESTDLQATFATMLDRGVSAVAMEVSSHALVKGRTDGCEFDVGVFTNLTQDHLDFHHTLDEYFEAKLLMFEKLPLSSQKRFVAVVNADDPRGGDVKKATRGNVLMYGIRNDADVKADNVSLDASGSEFDVSSPAGQFHVSLKLGGIFNVYNALAAIGSGIALGFEIDAIVEGLQSVEFVPGRFVPVKCGQKFGVVIDYAHSPDSLANILTAARDLTEKRLIAVFGCGGDRDRTKRPIMGKIGAELADVCVVTSDNPRSEDPDSIVQEVLAGMPRTQSVEAITDRREAIERAIKIAQPGDFVVIAGKGHETYQIFKDQTIHFDDSEVVREVLGTLGSSCG